MKFRISPVWWPFLGLATPFITPLIFKKSKRFNWNLKEAKWLNSDRIQQASKFDIPELEYLELTVIVEEKAEDGFVGDAGVSYLFKSDQGSLLFDVGFGPERPAFAHNASTLGFKLDQVDSLCISHLHPDHMGGIKASRSKQVMVPEEVGDPQGLTCFVPDKSKGDGFQCKVVKGPQLLTGGIATTGPLARSLFFFGLTEEQALFARIKGKGLVIFTGCGHPTIEIIVQMVQKIYNEPIYAIGGGLHFPVTAGRGNRLGIQFQTIIGTGKPVWQKITSSDLDQTIGYLNSIKPVKFFPSAHDTCDNSLDRMQQNLTTEMQVLSAGSKIQL